MTKADIRANASKLMALARELTFRQRADGRESSNRKCKTEAGN
jgi:hypothetical protein